MDVVNWARKQAESVALKFRDESKSQDLKFDEVLSLAGKELEIADGVVIYVLKLHDDKFIIRCTMEDGAILSSHYHSDYDETFLVTKGQLIDDDSGVCIGEDQNAVTFYRNIPHTPRCIGDTDMIITGIRC